MREPQEKMNIMDYSNAGEDEGRMAEEELMYVKERNAVLQRSTHALFEIIDRHFHDESFNRLAREFIDFHYEGASKWRELTVFTHYMLGGSSPRIYDAAARTALIILSLDVLDDIHDQDQKDPPWMQCELAEAMNCASNLLLAGIAGNGGEAVDPHLLKLLTTAHNGQHKDLRGGIIQEEDYLELVGEKSASLLKLAIYMGYCLLDHRNPVMEEKLAEFAYCVGTAAQLRNDMRDLDHIHSRSDFIQRKRTLATMFLLERCEESYPLLKVYFEGGCGLTELQKQERAFKDFIQSSGVFEYSSALQALYTNHAEQIILTIPSHSPWDHLFRSITVGIYPKKN